MLLREHPHVVILGGGFGGLAAARALRRAPVSVTLIDRVNHHVFQPLLYQVATAALTAPDVSAPIRRLLRNQHNARVWMGEVSRIDPAEKRVVVDGVTLGYDYLIVALGMQNAYFGHDGWAKHAPGLKTVGDALDIRRRILRAFEAAERSQTETERRTFTTFAVIGGGPTGVELAGAIAEIAGRTLAREFRNFNPRMTRVLLLEAGPRLLPSFPEHLSRRARNDLEHLGVEVRTGAPVSEIGPGFVEIAGTRIATHTVLWAAGVRASELTVQLGAPLDRAGRLPVRDDLSLSDHPEVLVVGDLIGKMPDGGVLPGVAQVAIQSGRHAALNVLRSVQGRPRAPFRYVDRGAMATIGRHRAVARLGRFTFTGIFAWWLWVWVHVFALVNYRARIAVLFEWSWSYFTWQRRSRVILEVPVSPPRSEPRLAPVSR
ncbi:MAG TPA: NAD(P)/FAD-dependent oxidoreductase [Polyangiaceae bacterium]|nr:NAD(P)/FAD-dependent oxidoreductase [Polyangiaceae bacterium]